MGLWWHMWRTKPLNGTVTLLASIILASASAACLVNCCCVAAYAGWAVTRTLRQRASALFVRQVHFRVPRSVMPIAQSPIRLIVMRSSTPSLTRHCLMALGHLPRVVEFVSMIYTFCLVMCVHDVLVVASAINNVDCRMAQPNVASRHDKTKVLDWRICCSGGRKQTSFIAGAMALHCNGKGSRLARSI